MLELTKITIIKQSTCDNSREVDHSELLENNFSRTIKLNEKIQYLIHFMVTLIMRFNL